MNRYRQLTSGERYALSALRKQGCNQAAIARVLGRHRSTISREVRRNSKDCQGRAYRPDLADDYARWRRGRSRRNERFGACEWRMVEACIKQQWSPEQAAGWLRRKRQLSISHETIYRYIWRDRKKGGGLYLHLRCSPKQRRKRYGSYDSRGRLAGKRPLSERSAGATNRSRVGHLEADTVIGNISDKHCVLTLVDRKSGYVMIGKLETRTVEATNRRAVRLINSAPRPHSHRHGRQRNRVPRLQGDRSKNWLEILLRDALSLLGARHLREHQRTDSSVPTEASEHGSRHPTPLLAHRPNAQQQTS